jgi:ABC-type polysaccharide/polyol phosphate export permease
MDFSSFTNVFDSKTHESYLRYTVKNLRDIYLYRFALNNFVRNNLRMRYRRSALGFVWSLLNPLLVMGVISFVFSVIFKEDIRTFAIYIFSGLAPWGFMSATIQGGCMSLVYAEGYLKKLYVPKMLFPMITVTTEVMNFFFSIISLALLALFLGFHFHFSILLLPFAVLVTYLFILGSVIIMSVATVYFRDLSQIVSVLFAALFYMVPILYPIEKIPEQFRAYFYLNPFLYFIQLFRKVILGEPQMVWSDWVIPIAISLVVMAAGLYVLMKRDRDIIYRL